MPIPTALVWHYLSFRVGTKSILAFVNTLLHLEKRF